VRQDLQLNQTLDHAVSAALRAKVAQDLDIRGEKIMNLKGTRTPWIAPFEKHDFEVSESV